MDWFWHCAARLLRDHPGDGSVARHHRRADPPTRPRVPGGRIGWLLVILIFPVIGALTYLLITWLARGRATDLGAAPQAAGVPEQPETIADLTRLDQLRRSGAISEADFEAGRRRVLEGGERRQRRPAATHPLIRRSARERWFWHALWICFVVIPGDDPLAGLYSSTFVFRQRQMAVWKRIVWLIVVLVLPLFGALIYISVYARGIEEDSVSLERPRTQDEVTGDEYEAQRAHLESRIAAGERFSTDWSWDGNQPVASIGCNRIGKRLQRWEFPIRNDVEPAAPVWHPSPVDRGAG